MSPLDENHGAPGRPLRLLLAAAVAAVAAVAVAVTACGANVTSGSGSPSAPAPVTTTPAPDPVALLTEAVEKTERESLRFTISLVEDGETTKVQGTLDAPRSASALSMTVEGEPLEFRIIKDTVYMRSPQVPGGKWARFRDNAAGTPFAPLVAALSKAGDQSDAIKAVKKARNLRKVGTETIDGVQTTKYAATVKGLEGLPAGKAVGLVWWVDGEGRLARATATLDGKLVSDARYTDYGTAAAVTAPPAAEVVDGKSLFGG